MMETHLLDPLGTTSTGPGSDWLDAPGAAEQDHFVHGGAWTPAELSLHVPYAELAGPSGGVHLSVEDWATFIPPWFPGQTPAIRRRAALAGRLRELPNDPDNRTRGRLHAAARLHEPIRARQVVRPRRGAWEAAP